MRNSVFSSLLKLVFAMSVLAFPLLSNAKINLVANNQSDCGQRLQRLINQWNDAHPGQKSTVGDYDLLATTEAFNKAPLDPAGNPTYKTEGDAISAKNHFIDLQRILDNKNKGIYMPNVEELSKCLTVNIKIEE